MKIERVLQQVKFGYINEELAQIIVPLIPLETLADTHRTNCAAYRSELLARFEPKNQTES